MRLASPGDVVLSFANAQIAYVGRIVDFAITVAKPAEFGLTGTSWSNEGWLLPIKWLKLATAVRPKDHLHDIAPILPKKYSPLHPETGSGNQKAYLAEISYPLFEIIANASSFNVQTLFDSALDTATFREYADQLDQTVERQISQSNELSRTEKELIIRARRGQGAFRENVMRIESQCRITGVTNPSLLIASHIKPWRSCVNANERLDGNNGLLLTPHVDLLFDRGFISFEDNGKVLISQHLNIRDLDRLKLTDYISKTTGTFRPEQCIYLGYHRTNVFLS